MSRRRRTRKRATEPARWAAREARAAVRIAPRGPDPRTQHPLSDACWRDYEQGGWCCPDCDANHPLSIAYDAQQEIAAWKETEHT